MLSLTKVIQEDISTRKLGKYIFKQNIKSDYICQTIFLKSLILLNYFFSKPINYKALKTVTNLIPPHV